jgi:hypothetical protein
MHNTVRQQISLCFDEFLKVNGITQGTVPVHIDRIFNSFTAAYPTLPVTIAALGRICTERFLKKPLIVEGTFKQCYYLNKEI